MEAEPGDWSSVPATNSHQFQSFSCFYVSHTALAAKSRYLAPRAA